MGQYIEKPQTHNRRLELTDLAKPANTRGLTGMGPGLAHQDAVGQVSGQCFNQTNPFLQSKPGLLAGYPDRFRTLARFWSCSASYIFAHWMPFWRLESLCLVQMVRCSNVILPSVDRQLSTSKTFTCGSSSSPIAQCAMHWNHDLEKRIHCCGNWETMGNTSKRWYSWLREVGWSDGKQEIIWKIKHSEAQKASSGIWNASPQRQLSSSISCIWSISVCLSIWWTV